KTGVVEVVEPAVAIRRELALTDDLRHDPRGALGAEETSVVGGADAGAGEHGGEDHLSGIVKSRNVKEGGNETVETVGAIRRKLALAHDQRQVSRAAPEDTAIIGRPDAGARQAGSKRGLARIVQGWPSGEAGAGEVGNPAYAIRRGSAVRGDDQDQGLG